MFIDTFRQCFLVIVECELRKKLDFVVYAPGELIFMFLTAIPSLLARDCSKNEKEALNYLFLLVPLLNVIIPFFWKSFAVVWSTDIVTFFGMYAWKVSVAA